MRETHTEETQRKVIRRRCKRRQKAIKMKEPESNARRKERGPRFKSICTNAKGRSNMVPASSQSNAGPGQAGREPALAPVRAPATPEPLQCEAQHCQWEITQAGDTSLEQSLPVNFVSFLIIASSY
ncbi:unnamed protein product [Caretta caretta]